MPGYSMHLISAMSFLNALHEKSPEFEEAIHHNFMLGQILPDLSPWSPTNRESGYLDVRHFRDSELEYSKHSYGIILLSDLSEARKYLMCQKCSDLKTRAYLAGIYFHLCLDTYFFTEYMYTKFGFTDEKVIDLLSGRSYSHKDFISKKGTGVYNIWDCMTALYWDKVSCEVSKLPDILPDSGFLQYDTSRTIQEWKKEMLNFANSANFFSSAIDISYSEVYDYLTSFAKEMENEPVLMDFLCHA